MLYEFILVLSLIFLLVEMSYISANVSLDKAILFFISMSHLASRLIVKLKYLKVPTFFIVSPLHRMLQECLTGLS